MKTKSKSVKEVDDRELDKSITAFLTEKGLYDNLWKGPCTERRAYCFVASEEVGNDSTHEFGVEPEQPEDYDMNDFKKGEWHYKTATILNWMCAEGKIESGDYIVSVCW